MESSFASVSMFPSHRPRTTLSLTQARCLVLGAQGFSDARTGSSAVPNVRRMLGAVRRLGLLQIDSVNVLARAHYLPLFSRLGSYPTTGLDALAFTPGAGRPLFEYWGHEASLLPTEFYPPLRWRMERAARSEGVWGSMRELARRRPLLLDEVLAEVTARGPLRAAELIDAGARPRGADNKWWGWSDAKRALEFLFWSGRLTAAGRTGNFERLYDLPERVLPVAVFRAPAISEAEAQRALLRHALRALGVATEGDLRDYFRLDAVDSKARVAEMVEAGELLPVKVEGWAAPAFLDPAARVPRRAAVENVRALLSPFDPLVWERTRTERLFGFRYRLEIYTPAHRRVHGYYVLPFLLGERLTARVDLKAERGTGTLRVCAAHAEPSGDAGQTAAALTQELREMAAWLGLERVRVDGRGDLAAGLGRCLEGPAPSSA